MDESFLSNEKLVKASKAFVCIRLATYEDKAEAEFLKSIFRGRSGELENTVFCLLDPTGRKKLCRPGRSPNFAYRSPDQMAVTMTEIAHAYAKKVPKKLSTTVATFPQMKSVRLALNVASCDRLPCVIVAGKNKAEIESAKARLAKVVWDDELLGKFVFASTISAADMKPIAGTDSKSGIYVVEPDVYGLKGKTIKRLELDVEPDQAMSTFAEIAKRFKIPQKDHRKHVTTVRRRGIDWESEVPVTDPGAARARERTKNKRRKKKSGQ